MTSHGRRLMPFLLLAWLGVGCGGAQAAGPITPEDLEQRLASGTAPLVLDVRSEQEFADGHLPGARNIPHDQLAGRLEELGAAHGDEIVVHCHSGRRAALAEEVLQEAGYTRVRDLSGHWQQWQEAGRPTE